MAIKSVDEYNFDLPVDYSSRRKPSFNYIFIPAFIFIIFIAIFSYYQVSKLISANSLVMRTYSVIQATDNSLYDIVDIETHQRGYLITGDSQFLVDRDLSVSRMKKDLNLLDSITTNDKFQNEKVKELINVIINRLNALNAVIKLKSTNKLYTPEGMQVFKKGQQLSDHAKFLGKEIKSLETILLKERTINALDRAHVTNVILVIVNIISLVFLLIAFVLANREIAIRFKYDRSRKNAGS